MKRLMLACCLWMTCLGAYARDADTALRRRVNAFVDEWHDDAAHARPALSMVVPNPLAGQVTRSIKQFEASPAAQ